MYIGLTSDKIEFEFNKVKTKKGYEFVGHVELKVDER